MVIVLIMVRIMNASVAEDSKEYIARVGLYEHGRTCLIDVIINVVIF